MQNLIVAIIVALAAFYLLRRFIRSIKTVEEDACGCGCSTCPEMSACEAPEDGFTDDAHTGFKIDNRKKE